MSGGLDALDPWPLCVRVQENAGLRRQLDQSSRRLHSVEGELGQLKESHGKLQDRLAVERKGFRETAQRLQSQLLGESSWLGCGSFSSRLPTFSLGARFFQFFLAPGAVRRLYFLGEEYKRQEASVKERERYVRRLETQLIQQHKVIMASTRFFF